MGVTDERVKDASSVSDLGHVRMELPSMELGGGGGLWFVLLRSKQGIFSRFPTKWWHVLNCSGCWVEKRFQESRTDSGGRGLKMLL